MAKRTRRSRKKTTPRRPFAVQPPAATQPAPRPAASEASAPAPVTASNGRNNKVVDFAQEYLYVYYDMRSVLIISLVMFVILFGLGFAI